LLELLEGHVLPHLDAHLRERPQHRLSDLLGILQSGAGAQPSFDQLRLFWYAADQLLAKHHPSVEALEEGGR